MRTTSDATRAPGARLARFLDHERRNRVLGRHRAVDDLHRRSKGDRVGDRLRQFLRIDRGHTT